MLFTGRKRELNCCCCCYGYSGRSLVSLLLPLLWHLVRLLSVRRRHPLIRQQLITVVPHCLLISLKSYRSNSVTLIKSTQTFDAGRFISRLGYHFIPPHAQLQNVVMEYFSTPERRCQGSRIDSIRLFTMFYFSHIGHFRPAQNVMVMML